MTLRRRVAVLAAVAVVLLLAVGALIWSRYAETVVAGTSVYTEMDADVDRADRLVLYRVQSEGDLQDLVLTGRDANLASFRRSLEQADTALAQLTASLGDDSAVAPALAGAEAARQRWWREDAGPTLALVRLGRLDDAAAVTQSDRAWAAYDAFIDSASAVQSAVDEVRAQRFADLAGFARQLGVILAGAAIAFLALVVLVGVLLNRWVLDPLDSLRRQLRAVARRGEHERVITPAGPPELHAAGEDAESLRRQLVSEIDQARAAREGLAQDAPVVAALRRELRATRDPIVPGLLLHGEVQAAEGVLAGDWWDWVSLPDGRAAVVVTDVAGHGAAAGVTAMRVKGGLIPVLEGGGGPAAAVTAAAALFAAEEAAFATAVVVEVDPGTGHLRWTNAGHHAPLLLRAAGPVERLAATGPLLSTLGGSWSEGQQRLVPGDVLLAYSDGLVESRDGDGEELGEEGLLRLLEAAWAGPATDPDELVARVVAASRERATDWRRDDVTVVALSLDPAAG